MTQTKTMITPQRFVRLWNQLHSAMVKGLSDGGRLPRVIHTQQDIDGAALEDVEFVVERLNQDSDVRKTILETSGVQVVLEAVTNAGQVEIVVKIK